MKGILRSVLYLREELIPCVDFISYSDYFMVRSGLDQRLRGSFALSFTYGKNLFAMSISVIYVSFIDPKPMFNPLTKNLYENDSVFSRISSYRFWMHLT